MQNSELEEKVLTRAKNAAYRYLTFRQRSRAEVVQKLREKEFDPSVIQTVLADLTRLGYINDEQFAAQWASSRVRLRGYGRRRIEQELKDKGLDRDVVRKALEEIVDTETERETARKEADKKLNTMKLQDRETRRRRLAGFLERKGFPYDIIRDILRHTD